MKKFLVLADTRGWQLPLSTVIETVWADTEEEAIILGKTRLRTYGIDTSECLFQTYELMPDEKQKITVPFSEEDMEDLRSWTEFNWTFPDQYGNDIDVLITKE